MKRNIYWLIALLFILYSCKEKVPEINKFIFIDVKGLVYDSLKQPSIWIFPYFYYEKNNHFKIATCHYFNPDSIAPPYGLNDFYELAEDQITVALINKTLINRSFDSTYNFTNGARYRYFLYETSDNKKGVVKFGDGYIPDGFGVLLNRLGVLGESDQLFRVKPFVIDSMLIKFENKLFAKYPPPPCHF
jgi:hypothetical protein